jgi:hybrid polyketide synthase/nonribosomal peptide synthetase FtdB
LSERPPIEPIAVVGMACRFPQAPDTGAFWRLLRDGVDAIAEVPADRWDSDRFYSPDPATPGMTNTRWAGLLDRIDLFDHEFFRISPREAAHMDPQQRLLLEVAWEALEDAGCPPDSLAGSRAGVFSGIMFNEYGGRLFHNSDPRGIDAYSGAGNIDAIVANRISYALDLHGPSLVVDTACSSSLVAVHLACLSLRNGECDLALAGGTNVVLAPGTAIYYSRAGLMAPDGRCKAFDARADGFVRGEGAGLVVLKMLSQALADGDPIRAVIRGSAVNHDGRGNGLTAPNPWAQERVIRAAYEAAGIPPARVGYVEAHGSGTRLGDPIELKALGAVVGAGRLAGRPCGVGSVKTNIGHLEAAAGIAGLIKAILCLQHRQIVPSLHFEKPSPFIPFDGLALRVPTRLEPWPDEDGPAVAGVSSFGFGGTNAHVVLEEAPGDATPAVAGGEEQGPWLLPLSARSPEALRVAAGRLRELAAGTETDLRDLCRTAAVRRSHHEYRLAVTCRSRAELTAGIDAFLAGTPAAGLAHGRRGRNRRRKVAFVFSGQGPQWAGMGLELMAREPVFRAAVEECECRFADLAGWSLLAELTAEPERSRLEETEIAQPALFALQIGLAALWRSWGIEPDAVVGHSVGEVAAACVAGCLTLDDALRVVHHRGRLMQRSAGLGRMASVGLSEEQARAAVKPWGGRLSIAALNGPSATVIAGEPAAVEELLAELAAREVDARMIRGSFAFHSPQMEPFSAELATALAGLTATAGKVPIQLTARVGEEGLGAAYWARQIAEPVLFSAAAAGLISQGIDTFLEIGPQPVLAGALAESLHQAGREGTVVPSLRRAEPDRETMLRSLGRLHALGCGIAWRNVAPEGRCVPLPAYPWQWKSCWLDLEPPRAAGSPALRGSEPAGLHHPFAGRWLDLAPDGRAFEAEIDLGRFPYLEDHRIQGEVVLPGTAYLEMVLAAATASGTAGPWWLEEIAFERPLVLSGGVTVQTLLDPQTGGSLRGRVYSRKPGGAWVLHARMLLRSGSDSSGALPAGLEEIRTRCAETESGAGFYRRMSERGNQWGPAFQGIDSIWRRDGEALALLTAPAALAGEVDRYVVHPALFDAAAQVLAATLPAGVAPPGAFVGAGGERLWIGGEPLPARLWSHAVLRSVPGEHDPDVVGDIVLLDDSGRPLVWVLGARLRYLTGPERLAPAESPAEWLYRIEWPEAERRPEAAAAAPCRWLLLADRGGVAEALAAQLREAGHDPLLVHGIAGLRNAIEAGGLGSCRGVVHLQPLDLVDGDAAALEAAHLAMGGDLLALVRELAPAGPAAPPVYLVTRGAQVVLPGERPASGQAPLWALGRALAQEHAALWGGLLDLDPAAGADEAAARLREALCHPDGEDQVAFRGGTRRAARLVRAQVPQVPALSWRRDATYLITGGLGDLGLLVARWMVEQGARRLILLGRTGLPPRSQWSETSVGATARRIAAVRELEALGASVHLAVVDIASATELADFLDEFRREGWPPVRGVVHAAGVAELRPLVETDKAALAAAFRPKATGAWHLHHLLQNEPLDFFVLFSSISPLHGAFGQGLAAYAAANASLDALAHHRRALGLPALSVGWGPWAEVGMAARRGLEDRGGVRGLPPQPALELLGSLLGGPGGSLAVMSIEWDEWGGAHPGAASSPLLSGLTGPAVAAAPVPRNLRDELLVAALEERAPRLEEFLRHLVSRVLGVSPEALDSREPLSDHGLDSLSAVEVKNAVERGLGVVLPMVHLLSGPSLADLAERLAERLGEELAQPLVRGSLDGAAFPLSHGQRALWFLYQREPTSAAYNVAFAGRIRSRVDLAALRQVLQWLVDRHAALRTRHGMEQGQLMQRVEPRREVAFTASGAAGLSDEELRRLVQEEYRHPFDLTGGPPFRARLFSRGDEDHVLLLVAHHIAVDGWSLFLLLDELRVLYPAALAGSAPPLPPLAAEYSDYVRGQEEMLAGPEGENLWEYWRRQLSPLPAPLELPVDHPRPKLQTLHGASHTFVLGGETAAGLRNLARAEGATLFMVLVTLLEVLLHRISGQGEFALGASVAGRDRADLDRVVGHFVNSVVLRANLAANPSFRELLRQVRKTVLGAFEHQDYPFPLLVERLQPTRDPSRSALFQVSFVLQNLPGLGQMPEFLTDSPGESAVADLSRLPVEPYPLAQQAGQHELELEVYERPGSLLAILQYNTDLFDESTIETLARRLVVLAASAVSSPEVPVGDLEMVSEAERLERFLEDARRRETDRHRLRISRRRGVPLAALSEDTEAAIEGESV